MSGSSRAAIAALSAVAGAAVLAAAEKPRTFVLPDVDGEPVALDTFRGRPVLINFWATWCEPCRAEIPDLEALAIREAGCLTILGVAVNSGSPRQVAAFARKRGVTYRILMGNERVAADFHVALIPHSLLLDARGREVASWIGQVAPGEVRKAVRTVAPRGLSC